MIHTVLLLCDVRPAGRRNRYCYRAVCRDCDWGTPWRTTAPGWPDQPERSWLTPRSIVVRAAGDHIRLYARAA